MGCHNSTLIRSRDFSDTTFANLAIKQPEKHGIGARFPAYAKRIIDGDTIEIAFYEGYSCDNTRTVVKENIRLAHINAPEIHTKDAQEKERALRSKDALSALVSGKNLMVTFTKREKFGRPLCEISTAECTDVNRVMIQSGHAVPYEGGAR